MNATTESKIIQRTDVGNGVEVHLIEMSLGYNVKIYDADAELYLPQGHIFPTKERGLEAAAELAERSRI